MPRYWLIKGKDRLTDWSAVLGRGVSSTWFTRKPPRAWEPGDAIVFWRASPHLELVGFGRFDGVAQKRRGETLFQVQCHTPLRHAPVPAESLKADPALKGSAFLKSGPAGTVFQLTHREFEALRSHWALHNGRRRGPEQHGSSANLQPFSRALPIKWDALDMILEGKKTWEIRGTPVKMRGSIALIESGSGHVVGAAELVDCIGPLSLAELRRNARKVGAKPTNLYYMTTYAWVLRDARRLPTPVPYRHPYGAIVWTKMAESTRARIKRGAGVQQRT